MEENKNYTAQLTVQELERACKTALNDMLEKHIESRQKK